MDAGWLSSSLSQSMARRQLASHVKRNVLLLLNNLVILDAGNHQRRTHNQHYGHAGFCLACAFFFLTCMDFGRMFCAFFGVFF